MGRNKDNTKPAADRVRDGVPVASIMEHLQEDLERSKESSEGVVRDRFDLEQEILECWRVTSDIQLFAEQGADLNVLSAYYDQKFERLWATFESMCHNGKLG